MAEWSKALALGASPKGRGFEPHQYHYFFVHCRSETEITQIYRDIFNLHSGVTDILVQAIRHFLLFLPDANNDTLVCLAKCGTSTALCQGRRLKFLVEFHKAIFFITYAYARFSDATGDRINNGEFIYLYNLLIAIFSFLLHLVSLQAGPIGRDGPRCPIFSIYGCTINHMSLGPLLLFLMIAMFNHVNEAFPT